MYKSTFYSLKICPKNRLDLYMGQKHRSQKKFGPNFQVTIVYLKGNSKLKTKFFKNILTQKSEKHFLAPNRGGGGRLIHGVDLYTV